MLLYSVLRRGRKPDGRYYKTIINWRYSPNIDIATADCLSRLIRPIDLTLIAQHAPVRCVCIGRTNIYDTGMPSVNLPLLLQHFTGKEIAEDKLLPRIVHALEYFRLLIKVGYAKQSDEIVW